MATQLATQKPVTGGRTLFRVGEAADRFGCSRTLVYDLIARHILKTVSLGADIRITLESIEALEAGKWKGAK